MRANSPSKLNFGTTKEISEARRKGRQISFNITYDANLRNCTFQVPLSALQKLHYFQSCVFESSNIISRLAAAAVDCGMDYSERYNLQHPPIFSGSNFDSFLSKTVKDIKNPAIIIPDLVCHSLDSDQKTKILNVNSMRHIYQTMLQFLFYIGRITSVNLWEQPL